MYSLLHSRNKHLNRLIRDILSSPAPETDSSRLEVFMEDLFNFVCNTRVDWRTHKKTRVTRYLSRQKQSTGGVNVVACKRTVIMDSFMSDVKKKS